MNSKSNIVIFGASGFVGSHLTKALLADGYNVTAISRPDSSFCFPISAQNLTVIPSHSLDFVRSKLKAIEVSHFFHLAANVNVKDSLTSPEMFIKQNLDLTYDAIQLAELSSSKVHFILLSSDRIFGKADGVVKELSTGQPVDPYGFSKYLSEEVMRFYAGAFNSQITIARAVNLYGPFQRSQQFLSSVFKKYWNGEDNFEVGNLEVSRNYIYIDDLITGLMSIVRTPHKSLGMPNIFHFGGKKVTLHQIATEFSRIAQEKYQRKINFTQLKSEFRNSKNELGNFEFNFDATHDRLGWSFRVGMEHGLELIFKSEGKAYGKF
jgi:UDP-glucose 4-epimerase